MPFKKLSEVDLDATHIDVGSALDNYNMYLLKEPEDLQPKITASFSLVPLTPNNQFHSTTESVALDMMDAKIKRKVYLLKYKKR
ncbi:hypothetical protein LG329_18680 [Virgibacillus necropolis]|uniref:ArpU family phage packaging/lysis transcriptional regulator n=1 Tax=Virgibacillus necropolis TaxID=163877 RepID=UPI00384CFEE7